jgi:D-sedoheptulose 7-phosphate isomerase
VSDAKLSNYVDEVSKTLSQLDLASWNTMISFLDANFVVNKRIFVFGNGGSASLASHFATDWTKGIYEKIKYQCETICLNDNVSLMTAISNDFSYDQVFSKQLEYLAKPGEVAFAISGSGNSPNVIKAATVARKMGLSVASLTGFSGGELKKISDINLNIESENMQIIEDIFSMFGHAVYSKLVSHKIPK